MSNRPSTSSFATSAPDPLDRARRDWLANLARSHAVQSTAQTALALAQGEWRCGEYADALIHFTEARDRAPEVSATHLSLVRAASMLGRKEVEQAALAPALAHHSGDPMIALHAALTDVPNDMPAASARLASFTADPACAEFARALAVVNGDLPVDLLLAEAGPDPARQARAQSLRWACAQGARPDVHVGLPPRVLEQALVEAAEDGLTLECGVYFGRSLGIIARHSAGQVHGFDSFQGLPEAWSEQEGAGAYSTAGRLPAMPPNVTLHAGWFDETLPRFLEVNAGPIRLLHIDCDIYSSTRTVLDAVGDRLQPGSVIVFDDMLGYPGYEAHELRAFEEFVQKSGMRWELLAACLMGREVAIRITSR
jgi:predicted O-methyltransferase YrrM